MAANNARRWEEPEYYEFGAADGTYGYSYSYQPLPAPRPYTEYKKREQKLTVKADNKKKIKGIPSDAVNAWLRAKCLTLFLIASLFSMGLAVYRGLSAERVYQLAEIRREASKLERENEELKVEIARLKSPRRIKEKATSELGMIVPVNAYFSSDKGEKEKETKN